jgi:hypothetical protein
MGTDIGYVTSPQSKKASVWYDWTYFLRGKEQNCEGQGDG